MSRHLILIYIPPNLVVFLKVALWSFNKLYDHATYKNYIWEIKKRVIINHMTYKEQYYFISIYISTKFRDCSSRKSCDITFLVYHRITWSKVMSPNGCILLYPSDHIWFACLFWKFDIIIKKIGNTKSHSY